MKQATITLTDDLEQAIESYRQDHDSLPGLDAVVQQALREYLSDRGYFSEAVGEDINWPDDIIPGSGHKPVLFEDAPTLLDGSSVADAVIEDRR